MTLHTIGQVAGQSGVGVDIERIGCPSCDVQVLDMKDPAVAERAKGLGIRSVLAVMVDGRLADCCAGGGPEEETLRTAGVGTPIP